jgi:hypothetical protein
MEEFLPLSGGTIMGWHMHGTKLQLKKVNKIILKIRCVRAF